MKKPILFIAFISICIAQIHAQFNYNSGNAENLPGVYSELGTSGSIISTANMDDANSAAQNIGFTFDYNGQSFTQFILNTNGFIKLGSTPPSAANLFFTTGNSYVGGVFGSTNAADENILAPFNHDLEGSGSTTEYRVSTTGSAGSRVCVIQFKNVKDKTTAPAVQFDSINFQIKLFETTNIIEFVYGDWFSSTNASAFKSSGCGLKGGATPSNSQMVLASKASTQPYDQTAFVDTFYPGNAFNFGNNFPAPGRPIVDPGRTFKFTPAFLRDILVDNIIAHGELAVPYALPHLYEVNIRNIGINNMTGFYVYIDITGANTHQDSVLVGSLPAGLGTTVNLGAYTPVNLGVQDIHVYVGNDSNNINNSMHYRQEISHKSLSHVDTSKATSGIIGYPVNAGGMILHRYIVNKKRKVLQTGVRISDETTNIGKTIYGVVLSGAGTLLARSSNYVITANDLGEWKDFDIEYDPINGTNKIGPPTVNSGPFFIGIAATGASVRYNPVGHIAESPIRGQAFYSLPGFISGVPTAYDDPTNLLEYRSFLRTRLDGNKIELLDVSLTDPSCPDPSATVTFTIKNQDVLDIDFSVDTMHLMLTSTGAVSQSFPLTINSGILMADSSQVFTITTSFDLSQAGIYNISGSAVTDLEVDTPNNYKNYNIEVIISPEVDLTVSPDSVICDQTAFEFTAHPKTTGSISYQWLVNGIPSGSPTTNDKFSPTLNSRDTVSVELTTDHCSTTQQTIASNDIVMKLNPEPVAISGSFDQDTVLQFTTKNYVVGVSPGSSYSWSVDGGYIVGNSTGSAVVVSWDTANTNASVSVTETDAFNCVRENIRDVLIFSAVGIEDHKSNVFLGDIYPNPTDDVVNIPFFTKNKATLNLSLMDMTGKEVASIFNGNIQGERSIQFSTKNINPGMYFIRIKTTDGFEQMKRIAVQR